jgi:hypothetical protein
MTMTNTNTVATGGTAIVEDRIGIESDLEVPSPTVTYGPLERGFPGNGWGFIHVGIRVSGKHPESTQVIDFAERACNFGIDPEIVEPVRDAALAALAKQSEMLNIEVFPLAPSVMQKVLQLLLDNGIISQEDYREATT